MPDDNADAVPDIAEGTLRMRQVYDRPSERESQ